MKNINAYFISDLHLATHPGPEEIVQQNRFIEFINANRDKMTHLYIVGDLFDFWYEYKNVIPKMYFQFLHLFKGLTDQGVEIHYLAGNHDFSLGAFFDKELNISTHPDTYIFELAGKKFYLFHGDGVAKKDVGYRFLKRVLRNKTNQKLFRWLHPDWGIPLAKFVSGSSRKYTNQINLERDESDYIEFAEKKFDEGYDFVIMGHRHNPLKHEKDNHIYINLGDWITLFSYALFDGARLELKYFDMKKA
jgi:UDP-2,3-diacylglucosamine hydrolase